MSEPMLPGDRTLLRVKLRRACCPRSLREQLGDRLAFAGTHAEWALCWRVDDFVVRDAEGVADGGVEVGCGDFVFGDGCCCFVGSTVDLAALDAATCHEGGEGFWIVVASGVAVDLRRPPELGAEHDEGAVEQAFDLEVLE